MLDRYPLVIYSFRRALVFEHNGKPSPFTAMAWFIGNISKPLDYLPLLYVEQLVASADDDRSFATTEDDETNTLDDVVFVLVRLSV